MVKYREIFQLYNNILYICILLENTTTPVLLLSLYSYTCHSKVLDWGSVLSADSPLTQFQSRSFGFYHKVC